MKYTNFDDWFDKEILPLQPEVECLRAPMRGAYYQGRYDRSQEVFEQNKKELKWLLVIYCFFFIFLAYKISCDFYFLG